MVLETHNSNNELTIRVYYLTKDKLKFHLRNETLQEFKLYSVRDEEDHMVEVGDEVKKFKDYKIQIPTGFSDKSTLQSWYQKPDTVQKQKEFKRMMNDLENHSRKHPEVRFYSAKFYKGKLLETLKNFDKSALIKDIQEFGNDDQFLGVYKYGREKIPGFSEDGRVQQVFPDCMYKA